MFFGRSKGKKPDPKAESNQPQEIAPSKPAKAASEARREREQPEHKLMGQILVDAGLISAKALENALAEQKKSGKKLVETLSEMGALRLSDFERLMARQPGIASIDLDNYRIPPELIELIPEEFAVRHKIFPIDRLGKLLTVGMACPLDEKTIAELNERTGLRVKPILCSFDDIDACIRRYYHPHETPTWTLPSGNSSPRR